MFQFVNTKSLIANKLRELADLFDKWAKEDLVNPNFPNIPTSPIQPMFINKCSRCGVEFPPGPCLYTCHDMHCPMQPHVFTKSPQTGACTDQNTSITVYWDSDKNEYFDQNGNRVEISFLAHL